MRRNHLCPKCSARRFIVVNELRVPDHDSSNAWDRVPVLVVQTAGRWIASGRETVGRIELWICSACGYSEMYASECEGLEELARKHPDQVRIVDGGTSAGPFR